LLSDQRSCHLTALAFPVKSVMPCWKPCCALDAALDNAFRSPALVDPTTFVHFGWSHKLWHLTTKHGWFTLKKLETW
jgi:hypothetical protein